MGTVKFRVTTVPLGENEDLEATYSKLKNLVISCNLSPISWNVLRSDNDGSNHTFLDEVTIETECLVEHTFHSKDKYEVLCKNWFSVLKTIPPEKRPVISFYDDQTFMKKRIPYSKLEYLNFSVGTLPWPSVYTFYFDISPPNFFLNTNSYSAHFYHDIRLISINYDCVRLEIHYSNIRKVFYAEKDGIADLYLDLLNPPLVFKEYARTARNGFTYSIHKRSVTFSTLNSEILGKASVIRISFKVSSTVQEVISRLHFRCNKLAVHFALMHCTYKIAPSVPNIDLEHFGCTYLLIAVLTRNYVLIEQNIDRQNIFLYNLKLLARDDAVSLEKALRKVLYAIDSGKMLNYEKVIHSLCEWFKSEKPDEHYIMPENCCKVRRIFLTPTRKLMWPPDIVFVNRVLRNFDSDYTLRVSFREDNLSRLTYNAQYSDEDIFLNAIKYPMTNGIHIGDRHYEFLAWSNSQIRDHAVYMYAADKKNKTASYIRKWMGDFSHIHSVSKYMARMGQCFSQTKAIQIDLKKDDYIVEPDITRGCNPLSLNEYCFSDGIGKISKKFAAEVNEDLDIPKDQSCSAFQIRYRGFKGMLATDPTLENVKIVFRKSMNKFESEPTKLEIARTSQPVRLYLNRQIITILDQKKIPTCIFLKLQEDMLCNLTDILLDEEKAAQYLTSYSPFTVAKFLEIAQSGIGLTQEPFFRSLLLALHKTHVEGIRTKARLAIDPSEGRNMLGVLDETGILKYGQVFVQYTNDILGKTTDKTIYRGDVVVTKNPCLHPGDIRLFNAVDVPELHHIVDCIVFPQNGHRPHPDEMAGSDLDGDEYAVLWKKEFLNIKNETPMNFPSSSEKILSSIKVNDMINFLIEYIKNDQVGIFANAHLAHADRMKEGIRSSMCLSIAEKFSVVVDFAKSGKSESLSINERPTDYPDFMERGFGAEKYKSKKALGKLYRVCQNFDTENEYAYQVYKNIQVDKYLICPGWEKYKKQAINSRDKYHRLLKHLMEHYGVKHEGEIFSGAFSHLHSRHQQRTDKAEVEKVIVSSVKALWKNMRNEFFEEFNYSPELMENVRTIPEICTAIDQKASAWYVVTYSAKLPFSLSFPWIVSDFLSALRIKQMCDTESIIPIRSPTIYKLDQMLLNKSVIKLLTSHGAHHISKCSQDLKIALSLIIYWAQKVGIIHSFENQRRRGFLYLDTLINLFFHVVDKIDEHSIKKSRTKLFMETKSSAFFCMYFLKYCISLRFLNKKEATSILPFHVFRYKDLARFAMLTYHSIAISGNFDSLGLSSKESNEEIEMRPLRLPISITYSCPQSKMETYLKEWSGVSDIHFRTFKGRKNEFLLVSASGTSSAILTLENILNKDISTLKESLISGNQYVE